jgi:hypothetical protein
MLKIRSAKYLMALTSTGRLTKHNLIGGINKIFKDIWGFRLFGIHQMNFPRPASRPVHCPSCSSLAEIKLTKTKHLMLRCDFCKILIFANGPLSQAWLTNLSFY